MFRRLDAGLARLSAFGPDVLPDGFPDPDGAGVEEWRAWCARSWREGRIADAVRVASPTLAQRLDVFCGGAAVSPGKARRMAFALARYLVRMRGRATPFGLFAGIAPLHFSDRAAVHQPGAPVVHVRPDPWWLAERIAILENCPRHRRGLTVERNSLAFHRGDRLVVPWRPRPGGAPGSAATSVRRTPAVETLWRLAAEPIAVDELVDQLTAHHPDGERNAAESMVAAMIRGGALLTCLRPASTVVDPVCHVLDGIGDPPEPVGVLDELRAAACREPDVVDLVVTGEVVVPAAVAREVERSAALLERLSPFPHGHPGWRDFLERFLDRYGAGAVVPLTDVVDPTLGLGYPTHFDEPVDRPRPLAARDTELLATAQRAACDAAREVVLDPALLDRLAPEPPQRRAPHLDLTVEVCARSRELLDGGEFTVAVTGVGRTALATGGRFLHLLPPAEQQRRVEALRALPTGVDGAVAAQLSWPVLPVHADPVARARLVLPLALSVGEHRLAGVNRVAVEDLAVTADHDRLYLVSQSRGRVVEPVVATALARPAMPPLVRLLAELPRATTAAVGPFSWGTAASLPFLPRLRHGRTVLTPARWRVDPADLPGPRASTTAWVDALDAVRERRMLPDWVQAGTGDRQLRLNLDAATDRTLLRHHLDAAAGPIAITEAAGPAEFGWLDGRAHELTVPLAATADPAPAPRALRGTRPPVVITRDHGHLPGSGLVSARLTCHPDAVPVILLRHLPGLLARWDRPPRWWFLRLRTPAPALRLRFHISERADDAVGHLAAWVSGLRQTGLAGELTLDTYRPELARFTADAAPDRRAAAMAAAEDLFAADSGAACAQLAVPDDPLALTTASMLDLTASLLGTDHAAWTWLRSRRDLAAGSSDRGLVALAEGATDTAVAAAWSARREAARTYVAQLDRPAEPVVVSLLHLHHVRMLGPDPASEARCFRLARTVALSRLARRSPT